MDIGRILHNPTDVSWDYDEEADVLYVSVGKPQPALGVDIGHGVILRYDETSNAVVGLTVIGLRTRLQEEQNHQARINSSQRNASRWATKIWHLSETASASPKTTQRCYQETSIQRNLKRIIACLLP